MATKKRTRKKNTGGRERGLGVLFWLCLLVIVVAVGFAARQPIAAAIAQITGNSSGQTPQTPAVTVAPIAPSAPPPASPNAKTTPSSAAPTSAPQQPTMDKVSATPHAAPPATTAPTTRKARLFFATVDTDGHIAMKSVIRSVPASDSPLRDTLESLLQGPTRQELNLGMLSMIPVAARLRGVTMRGDVAMVDFAESFRQNPLGADAMTTQVRQVVYAATEFPSVKAVQILIEGQQVSYLGPEGLRIDKPLTRESFQN